MGERSRRQISLAKPDPQEQSEAQTINTDKAKRRTRKARAENAANTPPNTLVPNLWEGLPGPYWHYQPLLDVNF